MYSNEILKEFIKYYKREETIEIFNFFDFLNDYSFKEKREILKNLILEKKVKEKFRRKKYIFYKIKKENIYFKIEKINPFMILDILIANQKDNFLFFEALSKEIYLSKNDIKDIINYLIKEKYIKINHCGNIETYFETKEGYLFHVLNKDLL